MVGGGGSDGSGRRLCDEERCLCGSGHVTSGTGNNGQLLLPLLVFVACRFHLEHLVEAAGKLLGDPSLARLWETGGGSEADGGWFGLHGFVFLDILWRCRCLSRAAASHTSKSTAGKAFWPLVFIIRQKYQESA